MEPVHEHRGLSREHIYACFLRQQPPAKFRDRRPSGNKNAIVPLFQHRLGRTPNRNSEHKAQCWSIVDPDFNCSETLNLKSFRPYIYSIRCRAPPSIAELQRVRFLGVQAGTKPQQTTKRDTLVIEEQCKVDKATTLLLATAAATATAAAATTAATTTTTTPTTTSALLQLRLQTHLCGAELRRLIPLVLLAQVPEIYFCYYHDEDF